MTVQLTKAFAAGLDARRRVFLGEGATLDLLDHAPIGQGGYVSLVNVASGWHLFDAGINEPALLQIAESETVTYALLNAAVAFSIDGQIWKVDGEQRAAPIGQAKRIWNFKVKPIGEAFEEGS